MSGATLSQASWMREGIIESSRDVGWLTSFKAGRLASSIGDWLVVTGCSSSAGLRRPPQAL